MKHTYCPEDIAECLNKRADAIEASEINDEAQIAELRCAAFFLKCMSRLIETLSIKAYGNKPTCEMAVTIQQDLGPSVLDNH